MARVDAPADRLVEYGWPDLDEPKLLAPEHVDTVEQFLRLPEIKPALEYMEGRITQKVPPMGKHAVLQGWIAELFNSEARQKKIALALPELRFTIEQRSCVPDVSVYRWQRIPRDESGEIASRFTVPPDIAVEIVSPEQSVADLVEKCQWHVAHGTSVALLVNPPDHSITVFRLARQPARLTGAERIDVSDVIPGLRLGVAEVFGALRLD